MQRVGAAVMGTVVGMPAELSNVGMPVAAVAFIHPRHFASNDTTCVHIDKQFILSFLFIVPFVTPVNSALYSMQHLLQSCFLEMKI